MAKVDALSAGEKFHAKTGPDDVSTPFTVAVSCGTNGGRWFCVTHQDSFPNNLMKDNHIRTGQHRMVWVCFEHGPEQP